MAEGIIEEDYALFYEIWQEFDPEATMYISYDHVPELLDVLEPPLQVKNSFSEIEKIFSRFLYSTGEINATNVHFSSSIIF